MPDLSPLIDGINAVIDEIHLHVKCLGEDLLPHDREHIESNLAGGCARGLTLIAMHQQMDEAEHAREQELQQRVDALQKDVDQLEQALGAEAD